MVAPMKVGHDTERSLRFLRGKRWRFCSLTEMDLGRRTYLFLVHRVFSTLVRIYSKDMGQHSQEIPVLFRRSPFVRVLKFKLHKLSADVPGKGMGNDRWCAEIWFRYRKHLYVFFATHLNAGVQRVGGDGSIIHGPRWDAYVREIHVLDALLTDAIADPSVSGVIFQGDVNMMPFGEGNKHPDGIYALLRKHRMDFANTRVVLTAWWGMRSRAHQVFPPGRSGWGSDHGCQVVDLERDPGAKKPVLAA